MTQRCCVSTGTAARQENATPAREPTAEPGERFPEGGDHRGLLDTQGEPTQGTRLAQARVDRVSAVRQALR